MSCPFTTLCRTLAQSIQRSLQRSEACNNSFAVKLTVSGPPGVRGPRAAPPVARVKSTGRDSVTSHRLNTAGATARDRRTRKRDVCVSTAQVSVNETRIPFNHSKTFAGHNITMILRSEQLLNESVCFACSLSSRWQLGFVDGVD